MKLAIFAILAIFLVVLTDAHQRPHHKNNKQTSVTPKQVEVTPKAISYGGLGARRRRALLSANIVGQAFCSLYKFSTKRGTGPTRIKSFIAAKFPSKWHNHLFGKLAYKGILAIVDVSAKLCGVDESTANQYLDQAKALEPVYDIELDNSCYYPTLEENNKFFY